MRKIGRPPKYDALVGKLEDDELYSPASITMLASSLGLLKPTKSESMALVKRRLRVAMARLSHNHRFPPEGDGLVLQTGQCAKPAWFGWRWKHAYL